MMPLSSRTCQPDFMIHVAVRRQTSCCLHTAVQAEVALHLAVSPEQLVGWIYTHSLSIRRQSVMSNRRHLCLLARLPIWSSNTGIALAHVQIRWIACY